MKIELGYQIGCDTNSKKKEGMHTYTKVILIKSNTTKTMSDIT